jgi:putative flippase GtrA
VIHGGLPPAAAKLAGISVAFLFNFTVNALFVFRKPR